MGKQRRPQQSATERVSCIAGPSNWTPSSREHFDLSLLMFQLGMRWRAQHSSLTLTYLKRTGVGRRLPCGLLVCTVIPHTGVMIASTAAGRPHPAGRLDVQACDSV